LAHNTGRPKFSDLTAAAANGEVLEVVLFSSAIHMQNVLKHPSPGARVAALSSMPETALQAIAAAFCGFPYTLAPEPLDEAPYDEVFGRAGYKHPIPGSKLELTGLFVLVPIHLQIHYPNDEVVSRVFDLRRWASIQGKLVAPLRGTISHSFGQFNDADADFIEEICTELLELIAHLGNFGSKAAFLESIGEPSLDELGQLLAGASASEGN